MKNQTRRYWEALVEEFEEVVTVGIDCKDYDENKIPDLEEIASLCPFKDLSERLLGYARVIECHII